ncbi:MAG: hypothetical protein Q4C42_08485, partial [Clostridia bacterium]|nr:hypothetical protein [Clostridia bacterium]
RMDVRGADDIESVSKAIEDTLANDEEVKDFVALKTLSCPVAINETEQIHLLVEVGNHSVFPVSYTEGREPRNDGEIALSVLQAKDMGADLGDSIAFDGEDAVVCGLYSDITNGGKTAKMCAIPKSCQNNNLMWSILYVTLNEDVSANRWIEQYRNSGADIVDIAGYVNATYGPTITQISKARTVTFGLAVLIVFVVVILFISLLIEKNRNDVSLQKALGFRNSVIRKQYMKKACLPVLLGIIIGAILAIVPGESICGMALSSLGASRFRFVISVQDVMFTLGALFMTGFVTVLLGTAEIRKISAYECCRGKE